VLLQITITLLLFEISAERKLGCQYMTAYLGGGNA
jgi:hypothetical protein